MSNIKLNVECEEIFYFVSLIQNMGELFFTEQRIKAFIRFDIKTKTQNELN